MKLRLSIQNVLWVITVLAVIATAFIARQQYLSHQTLVHVHGLIVADKHIKTLILEFITGDDGIHTEAISGLKSILREVDWNRQSEALLGGRILGPKLGAESFSIELVDITPKTFRDKKLLDCHFRSAATRMLQPQFELSYADQTGDGRLEFDVTECGAITYRYALKDNELVRCDFIVLKPNIFADDAAQKKFEESGEYFAR